ncbi:MAG: dicarboxylate/amino acid:cation symporter, partial [Planctomycetota bacterium]
MKGSSSPLILYGIVLGIVLGGIVGTFAPEVGESLGFIGDLFLQMLKLIVVPLVVTSMISGIAGLGDIRHVGRTGTRTIVFYGLTTLLSVTVGLVLVNIIQPGKGFERSGVEQSAEVQERTLEQLKFSPATHPDLAEKLEAGEMTRQDVIDELLEDRRKTPGEAILGILKKMFPPNIFQALAETNVLALI